jgi:hypothetical protein
MLSVVSADSPVHNLLVTMVGLHPADTYPSLPDQTNLCTREPSSLSLEEIQLEGDLDHLNPPDPTAAQL